MAHVYVDPSDCLDENVLTVCSHLVLAVLAASAFLHQRLEVSFIFLVRQRPS